MNKNCLLDKNLDQDSDKLMVGPDDKFGMLVIGRLFNQMATGGWKLPSTDIQPNLIANSFIAQGMSKTEKRMALGCCIKFVSMGASTGWTIAKWRAPFDILCQENLSTVTH